MKVRYIRDTLRGTTDGGNGCQWVEIKAIDYTGTNVALNKPVTASFTPSIGTLSMVTDGTISSLTTDYVGYKNDEGGNPYVQIDLGSVHNIDKIEKFHYVGKTYRGMVVQVSVDGTTWKSVFNSDTDGSYESTLNGKSIHLDLLPLPNNSSLKDAVSYMDNVLSEVQGCRLKLETTLTDKQVPVIGSKLSRLIDSVTTANIVLNYHKVPTWANYKLNISDMWFKGASVSASIGWGEGCCHLIGDKVYKAGGRTSTSNTDQTSYHYAYNVISNTWENVQALPTSKYGFASGVASNKLYIAGGVSGGSSLNTTNVYDPVTNTWTTLAPAPSGTSGGGCCGNMLDNNLYKFGREYTNRSKFDIYSTATNTWSTQSGTPIQDGVYAKSCILGSSLYFLSATTATTQQYNLVYNTVTQTWSEKMGLPTTVYFFDPVGLGEYLYVIGGAPGSSGASPYEIIHRYNVDTDVWDTIPFDPQLELKVFVGSNTCVVNQGIYIMGGFSGNTEQRKVNNHYIP